MLPSFLIFFREGLEIALILTIILAATRGVDGRNRWIAIGILGGLLGSALVAFFAENISQALEGMGQEAFNAVILFLAAFMIGWTVIWMQQHGRELSQRIKRVGDAVREGTMPLYALAVLVSVTMWREGSEIVLFMYGLLSIGKESVAMIALGGVAGAVTAAIIGVLLYLGLIRISTRYLFSVTGWLLILLAAGMSSQAAGFLSAAGWLPELVPQVWDSSHLLAESSLPGRILSVMLGYTERPTGIQLLFYTATLLLIVGMMKVTRRASPQPA